ncbi:hypothetical protein E4U60_004318 [Claviceps pazoutovae]|uniref:Uncharacterized protein n=1 Tax=Claviceps pazoutovae TaxID=1649127 RepID=A0A9P7M9B8_9HYPO|nr:hypothetical protein E4U60_004318 [Claviceps pazoutovae]
MYPHIVGVSNLARGSHSFSKYIWDTFQGDDHFTGHDSELKTYRGRAHLAEMIALLGPPPPSLLARANLRSKFFSDAGV